MSGREFGKRNVAIKAAGKPKLPQSSRERRQSMVPRRASFWKGQWIVPTILAAAVISGTVMFWMAV